MYLDLNFHLVVILREGQKPFGVRVTSDKLKHFSTMSLTPFFLGLFEKLDSHEFLRYGYFFME